MIFLACIDTTNLFCILHNITYHKTVIIKYIVVVS